MNSLKAILCAFSVLILASGCKTTRILPDKPVTGNLPEQPERLSSQITLPAEIDISALETYINQKLPSGKIAGGSGREGNTTRYSYSVYRNKPVRFSAKGNELIFRVPIDIRAEGSYTACIGFWRDGDCCSTPDPFGDGCATSGVTETEHGNTSPTVDVELRVKLGIREDYSVNADTYLKGSLSGDHHLHIDLIGDLIRINIDIEDKLEKPLQKFVNDYQEDIDKKVADLVKQYDIKSEVAEFWDDIKPVQMGDFWLDIQPEQVIFENLNTQKDKLRIAVGLTSKLEVTDQKPAAPDMPLPNLTLNQGTKGEFNIYLPAGANFDYLEENVREEIGGKKFKKDGVTVKIKDLDIRGVQLNKVSALLIRLDLKGRINLFRRFKGYLYFTAIPGINESLKVVSVEDFKIDANTNSFLLNNGLPYLVDNFYYEQIKDELKYSYQDEYDEYFGLLNKELKHIQFDDLVVNGELKELLTPGFYIDDNAIEVLLVANGTLKSTLQIK